MGDLITLDLADGIYEMDVPWRGMIRESASALVASTFPVKPPKQWFDDPGLSQLSPLTVDPTGRVYGHIAAWHTSHIGMAGGVKPPRSKSGYAFYRTGVVETDSGTMIPVGQITLAGGHASLNSDVASAVKHYDDTNTAIMDVAAGEDKHGIWVAGALRPSVSEEQIRSIRASSVSGDWRPINGRLELVAVCAVNCPGFPIPRARVAAGTPIALVAAGIEPLVDLAIQDRVDEGIAAGLEIFRERVRRVEDNLVATSYETPKPAPAQLRHRVHASKAQNLRGKVKAPMVASLRDRVHVPGVPDPSLLASLRDRVHVEGDAAPFDGLVAALRERVHEVDPLLARADFRSGHRLTKVLQDLKKGWSETLHPRGKDGTFVHKNGEVSGTFRSADHKDHILKRAKILGFKSAPGVDDPFVLVEGKNANGHTVKGVAQASEVLPAAGSKAKLPPFDKKLADSVAQTADYLEKTGAPQHTIDVLKKRARDLRSVAASAEDLRSLVYGVDDIALTAAAAPNAAADVNAARNIERAGHARRGASAVSAGVDPELQLTTSG